MGKNPDRASLTAWQRRPGEFEATADALGRPARIEGWLQLTSDKRTSADTAKQGSVGAGLEGREGGHLIAHRFGGPSDGTNLVPIEVRANRSQLAGFENSVATRLNNGEALYMRAEPLYKDDSRIPYAVEHNLYRRDADGNPVFAGSASTRVDVRMSQTVAQAVKANGGGTSSEFYSHVHTAGVNPGSDRFPLPPPRDLAPSKLGPPPREGPGSEPPRSTPGKDRGGR
jgi:hypothetical protein